MLPTLQASRVVLRTLRDEDVPALFEIFSDADAMRYWSAPPLANMGAASELLAEIHAYAAAGTLFQWGIARTEDDVVVGTTTLYQIDAAHRRAEIGFALARAAWGRGLAGEAVGRLIQHAFEDLDLHRIEADPDPGNTASIRLLEKQGFKYEGLMRERYFLGGQAMDAAIYGLLRREWTGRP
jgi:RimJ/RimL family protein N-acetyltransferase